MVVPEALMRLRGISASRFDKALASAAADVLGLQEDGSNGEQLGGDLGAGMDRRHVRFQGRTSDAARLAAAAASPASTPGDGSDVGAGGSPPPRPVMRSRRDRDGGRGADGGQPPQLAHVGGSAGGAAGEAPAPPQRGGGPRAAVTLDDGEVVATRADRFADLRRTIQGAGGDARLEALLESGGGEGVGEGGAVAARRPDETPSRADKAALAYGATRHPCLLQGGCSAAPRGRAAAACSLAAFPAVSCLEQLRHGSCAAAQRCACPWHHDDPSRASGETMLAESMIAAEGVGEEAAAAVRRRLEASVPAVAAILQLLADLVTAAVEEVDGGSGVFVQRFVAVADASSSLASQRISLLATALGAGAGSPDSALIVLGHDGGEQVLAVDAELALEAAHEAISDGATGTTSAHLPAAPWASASESYVAASPAPKQQDAARELEALWAEADEEERAEAQRLQAQADSVWSSHAGGAEGELAARDSAEKAAIARDLRALWGSYFYLPPLDAGAGASSQLASAPLLRLSPLLAGIILDRAAAQLRPGGSTSDEADRHALFWTASATLVRGHWQQCGVVAQRVGGLGCDASPLEAAVARSSDDEKWAPLLLLRSLAIAQHLQGVWAAARQGGTQEPRESNTPSHDPLIQSFLDEGQNGGAATAWQPASPSSAIDGGSDERPSSLLLHLVTGAVQGDHLRGSGGRDGEQGRALGTPPVRGSPASSLLPAWTALHRVVCRLCAGLIAAPSPSSSVDVATAAAASGGMRPLALLSFAQTPLISIIVDSSQALGDQCEPALLDSVGWQPWTDAQMFAAFQAAAYTPAAYVRHHQPLLAACCEASLLNAALLAATRWVEEEHGLQERRPLADTLAAPRLRQRGESGGPTDAVCAAWLRQRARRPHMALAASLRTCVPVLMAFVSALQDLDAALATEAAALTQEFRARRTAYTEAEGERRRGLRTRKYAPSDAEGGSGDFAEDWQTPLMDRLLPHGTVAVSAGATAGIVRLTLEGGQPYRAMRLSVSIARVARALRQAALQPPPRLVQAEKTVHRMRRSGPMDRKHVDRVRVPTLKLVRGDGEEAASDEGGGAGRRLGLLYQPDEAVVEEVVRAGLRMGAAGARLADGVVDDCVRGHIADYATGRCLPTPTLSEVSTFVFAVGVAAPLAASPAAEVLQLRGLGAATEREALHASRQIPPTAGLVELLVTHTAPTDAARQQRCSRLFTRDTSRFTASAGVVFGRQCALAVSNPQWALQAKECVWVATVLALAGPRAPAPSPWQAFVPSALDAKPATLEWAAPPLLDAVSRGRAAAPSRGDRGRGALGPTSTASVKALLAGHDKGDTATAAAAEDGAGAAAPALSPKERRRQRDLAKNPLVLYRPEALLMHVWERCGDGDGHHRQRVRVLWEACAGVLLGLPAPLLRDADRRAALATSTLVQAITAAVQLDHSGPDGDCRWVEETWKVLLLSSVWRQSTAGQQTAALPLSSAETPLIRDVRGALVAQARLAQALQPSDATSGGQSGHEPIAAAVAAVAAALLVAPASRPPGGQGQPAARAKHAGGSERTQGRGYGTDEGLAAWPLIEPLLNTQVAPTLAEHWLSVTLLRPSDSLLAWVVAHVDHRDTTGLAAVAGWLGALQEHGHKTAGLWQSTVESLHRRSLARGGHQSHARHRH